MKCVAPSSEKPVDGSEIEKIGWSRLRMGGSAVDILLTSGQEVRSRHVLDKGTQEAWSLSACTTLYRAWPREDEASNGQSTGRTRVVQRDRQNGYDKGWSIVSLAKFHVLRPYNALVSLYKRISLSVPLVSILDRREESIASVY
jgi:hypothetical protein